MNVQKTVMDVPRGNLWWPINTGFILWGDHMSTEKLKKRQDTPERRAYMKEYMRAYRKANRDKLSEYAREWTRRSRAKRRAAREQQ